MRRTDVTETDRGKDGMVRRMKRKEKENEK
jgi:hypothetical protein